MSSDRWVYKARQRSPFNKGLRALAQKLEASSGKRYDFALPIFIVFVIRFDVSIRDLGDHCDNLARLANEFDQSIVLGFEKLE
jgi:hypothetical protein